MNEGKSNNECLDDLLSAITGFGCFRDIDVVVVVEHCIRRLYVAATHELKLVVDAVGLALGLQLCYLMA